MLQKLPKEKQNTFPFIYLLTEEIKKLYRIYLL